MTTPIYTVSLHSRNHATVSGGVLPFPVGIKKLLGKGDANPKTAKNTVPTVGLSLLPHKRIGIGNLCQFATVCVDPCLANQGQGPVPSVMASRAAKSVLWFLAREWFLEKLNRELVNFRKRHTGTVGARLNMFSDIPWEQFGPIANHPGITFYDYSKSPRRHGWIRENYHVTYSFDGTEQSREAANRILAAGHNVSVVFHNPGGKCGKAAHRQQLPQEWNDWNVIDGGKTDWRPDDDRGTVVGLRLLARTYASRNTAIDSGFSQLHIPSA